MENTIVVKQISGSSNRLHDVPQDQVWSVHVTRGQEVHQANWREPNDDDLKLFDIKGDPYLLQAAIHAWSGEDVLILSDEELAEASGGWWSP